MRLNKKVKNIILILLLINTLLISATKVAFAMQPRTDNLNIYVKNYGEKDYYLDILTEESNEFYSAFSEDISKDLKNSNLYKYRDNDWMAHFIRGGWKFTPLENSFTGEDTAVNDVRFHSFYDRFDGVAMKVIVQSSKNNLIISNPVVFNFKKSYIFDMKTKRLEVINPYYLMYIEKSFPVMAVLFSVIFAFVMKLLISLIFRICRKGYVVCISTINQVMLYYIMYLFISNKVFDWVSIAFILSMLILAAVEYLVYRRLLKKTISLPKLLSFVIISNVLIIPFGWIFLQGFPFSQ